MPESAPREAEALRACFEGERTARCILAADGRILLANAAAHELLEARSGVGVRDGRIRTPDARAQRRLADALASPRRQRRAQVFIAERRGRGGKPVVCALEPIGDTALWSLALWRPRDEGRPQAIAALAEHYHLTPSQSKVAALLIAGCSVQEIAGRQGVSIETIRTHLRAIYAKMGVGSQAAVVAAAVRLFSL